MLKKILFSLLTLLLVYSAGIVGYKANEPDKSALTTAMLLTQTEDLDYDTLEDYTLKSGNGSIHYYLFYSNANDSSAYLENTILKSLAKDPNADFVNLLEYVNITKIEEEMKTVQMQKKWGVSVAPSLLACKVQDGKIIIESVLQWNEKEPLSEEDVKQWMLQNGLYKGYSTEAPVDNKD